MQGIAKKRDWKLIEQFPNFLFRALIWCKKKKKTVKSRFKFRVNCKKNEVFESSSRFYLFLNFLET